MSDGVHVRARPGPSAAPETGRLLTPGPTPGPAPGSLSRRRLLSGGALATAVAALAAACSKDKKDRG